MPHDLEVDGHYGPANIPNTAQHAGTKGKLGRKRKRFPHGNYTGYYSTRYGKQSTRNGSVLDVQDPRIDLLHACWFEGKKCLDIGCNEGHLTLALVRRFRPRRMVGTDIDGLLIQRARQALDDEIQAGIKAVKREAEAHQTEHESANSNTLDTTATGRCNGVTANDLRVSRPLMPRAVRGVRLPVEKCKPSLTEAERGKSRRDKVRRPSINYEGTTKVRTKSLKATVDATLLERNDVDQPASTTHNTDASVGIVPHSALTTSARKDAVSSPEQERVQPRSTKKDGRVNKLPRDTMKDSGIMEINAQRTYRKIQLTQQVRDEVQGFQSDLDGTKGARWSNQESAIRKERRDEVQKEMGHPDASSTSAFLSGCSVAFEREDFVSESHSDHGYDVVALFSVVKWMHINGGDEAIRRVFRKAYALLRPGGRFILEPQPWKSYKKSARQHGSSKAQANMNTIQLRPSDFPAVLTGEVGFRSWDEIGAPKEAVGGFANRSVHVYVK